VLLLNKGVAVIRTILSALVLTLFAQGAFAEKIYCVFTEPFINVVYNSNTNKVKIEAAGGQPQEVTVAVEFQQKGILQIQDLHKTHTMKVDLTKEGSDGMSDFIYPFEAVLDDSLYGGCETDHLKKHE
jgi:uncharacterized membrane protein